MEKRFLMILMVVVLGFSSNAGALPYSFSGSANGGTGSATMDFVITGNTLEVTIENTSSIWLDDGSYTGNSPGITGFGFDLDPEDLEIVSWKLEAYDDGSPMNLVTIGSDAGSPYNWEMGDEIGGIKLDYMPNTFGSVSGAIFNPDALLDPINTLPGGENDIYFSKAFLTMEFDESPIFNDEDPFSPFVRMQNVGADGEGSLKLGAEPIPEPATMLLLGAGFLGMAGARRRKFRR